MFSEVRRRVKKSGQPPGAAVYTGEKENQPPVIDVFIYNQKECQQTSGDTLKACLPQRIEADAFTWVSVEGLSNIEVIKELAYRFNLHPLTVEDILHVEQRPKVEEFDNYLFVTLKVLVLKDKNFNFSVKQLSIVLGRNFVLSFQEMDTVLFDKLGNRLSSGPDQQLRQHGADYLMYRLIDTVIDEYFLVLEVMGDHIEKLEETIIASPSSQNAKLIYKMKRQMLMLRKAIWPMREAISHLVHIEDKLISKFTRIYIRDVYDHTVQAIDTLETFRDMLSSMLDMYLSGLTNRMNEIMKTLTIIATIFIPITWISSIFGMNFTHMPELHWRWGYPLALSAMAVVAIFMLLYFRRKKWW